MTVSLFFFPFSSLFTVSETIVSVAVGIDFKQNRFHCFELKPVSLTYYVVFLAIFEPQKVFTQNHQPAS